MFKLYYISLNDFVIQFQCLSILIKGVGSFAIQFTEDYARKLQKSAVVIQTIKDNIATIACYTKQKYYTEKGIRYAVGDGIMRDGYQFRKEFTVKNDT